MAGLPPSKLPAAVADDDDDLLIAVPKDPVVEKAVKDSSFACGVDRKNALSFVTCSLANFTTTKLMLSMARLSEPLEEETRKDLVRIKTRMGSFNYSVSLASGEYVKLLQATFMNLENHDFLFELGMKTALDVFSDGTLKEDEVLSESAIDYCRELVSAELVSSAFYSERPPFCFLACLSRDMQVKENAARFASRLYNAMEIANADIENKALIKKQYDRMMWPHNALACDWLIAALECKFEGWPSSLKEGDMTKVASGLLTSVPVENLHSVVQDNCRQSRGGLLGRHSKWHRVSVSGILEDNEMPAPKQTAEHARQVLAEKIEIKNKLYETCTVDEYSLGSDDLRRLREWCTSLGVLGCSIFWGRS